MDKETFIEKIAEMAGKSQVGCARSGTCKADLTPPDNIGELPDSGGSFEWIERTSGTIRYVYMPMAVYDKMKGKSVRDQSNPPLWTDRWNARIKFDSSLLFDVDGAQYAISIVQPDKGERIVLVSLLQTA